MEKSTTFSTTFLHYSLPPDTEILHPRIYHTVKTTDIDNQYYLYPITCEYGSSMLEGVDFTVSYTPVSGIIYPCIIIVIESIEGLIIFVLEISN